jgi:hypothetical protein
MPQGFAQAEGSFLQRPWPIGHSFGGSRERWSGFAGRDATGLTFAQPAASS